MNKWWGSHGPLTCGISWPFVTGLVGGRRRRTFSTSLQSTWGPWRSWGSAMTTARPAPAGFWTEWRLWTTKMTPRMSPAHWCHMFNGPLNGESKFALCWVILDTNSETQRVHKKSPSYIADRASACVLEHHCVVWSGKYFKQIFWHGKVMYPAIYILGTSFLANGGWLSMRMTDSLPESLFLWMRRSWRREMMMTKMTLKLLLV